MDGRQGARLHTLKEGRFTTMQFTIAEIWEHTGLFARMIIFALGGMSIASLVVIAERMVVYRKSRSESRGFAARMGVILAKDDLETAANTKSGKDVGHLGRVINSGLTAYRVSSSNKDVAVESVARALERQAQREVQSLKRGLGVLATVGSTAPFVGLLGTTMGIVNAFNLMAAAGSGGLTTISSGIAEAPITAGMAYNFLQGWVDARSVDISESSNEFLDMVARHFGGSHS